MDFTDLGLAMERAHSRDRLRELEERVKELEWTLNCLVRDLHTEPALHYSYELYDHDEWVHHTATIKKSNG